MQLYPNEHISRSHKEMPASSQGYQHTEKETMPHPPRNRGHNPAHVSSRRPLFEELGYNYSFTSADPDKNSGYCLVYRTLKEKMDGDGVVTRIRADEHEVRLTELEGPFQMREKVKIYANDIFSYYKFNHRSKFVAICIDANKKEKTGYWFLSFDREGQLNAFCEYLNWLLGLDSSNFEDTFSDSNYTDGDYISCVDQRTGRTHSWLMNETDIIRKKRGMDDRFSEDSGFTDSDTDFFSSITGSRYQIPPSNQRYPSRKRDFRKM